MKLCAPFPNIWSATGYNTKNCANIGKPLIFIEFSIIERCEVWHKFRHHNIHKW